MAKKEFTYRGLTLQELKEMGTSELIKILPSTARRKMKRGFTDEEKRLIRNVKTAKKPIKTQCRSMIVLPDMVEKTLQIYNGKSFEDVIIQPEMIGHYLGEYSMTRKKVQHNAPGIGATKSSANVSVK
jgi:small subunit ribosomal protein S19